MKFNIKKTNTDLDGLAPIGKAPKKLSKKERKLIEDLAKEMGEKVMPQKGFFSTFKL